MIADWTGMNHHREPSSSHATASPSMMPNEAFAWGLTHIAVQEALNGKPVEWMEQVSDEQYRK
jgi:hypothetical protein